MALNDESVGGVPATMLVSPSGMAGYSANSGFGDFGGGWWILILFLLLGGWNNGFGGGGYGNVGGEIYPWMNQTNTINGGFRDQMLNTSISGIQNSITSGFGDVQTALCSGFAGVNASINGAQNAISQQLFSNQLANAQGFNSVVAQGADLKYTIATENCADRAALNEGIRDVMENCNRNNQAVLDKLCALELDGVKSQLAQAQRENVGLQNQLNMANLAASQTAQNAFIAQGFANEVDQLYNRLNACPVPTTPVYGRTPIFTCQSSGCGCGGNGGFVN